MSTTELNFAPVKDEQGNAVEESAAGIEYIDFKARGRVYQVAVQPSLYSTRKVFAYQKALKGIEEQSKNDKEGDYDEASFRATAEFLLIGALGWNVSDIALTQDGLLDGDYRVATAAANAIQSAIRPTSEAATATTPTASTTSSAST